MKRAKKRRETLRIAVVGAGRLGTALTEYLSEAGYQITEIVTRDDLRSHANGERLASKVGAKARTSSRAKLYADVVWFCVPDSQIATAAAALSGHDWRKKLAFHSSGVLSSDALALLRERGASVASLHPLMTFVNKSKPNLQGVPFAVEGDAAAIRIASCIIRDLGGNAFRIRKQNKFAYHAFAAMICPLLVSLLTASEKVASLAGMSPRLARRRMMPILNQTLANYAKLGPAASFSGPIVRGDAETIARHLAVLAKVPEVKRVYVGLALAAIRYLPTENVQAIQKALSREES
ncbi:MAG TPA: Rossmann-like and DUF2520 domain-containing protein [Terriglobales bacterium]|jgi:predicted short-subunit dehydrogenase-like oxidoreductase (DUF2520 family)